MQLRSKQNRPFVDPERVYYAVTLSETKDPIRFFTSVASARKYLLPAISDPDSGSQAERLYKIERVTLQRRVTNPDILFVTFLDRDSCTSLSQALISKKIVNTKIHAPSLDPLVDIVSTSQRITIQTDYNLIRRLILKHERVKEKSHG